MSERRFMAAVQRELAATIPHGLTDDVFADLLTKRIETRHGAGVEVIRAREKTAIDLETAEIPTWTTEPGRALA